VPCSPGFGEHVVQRRIRRGMADAFAELSSFPLAGERRSFADIRVPGRFRQPFPGPPVATRHRLETKRCYPESRLLGDGSDRRPLRSANDRGRAEVLLHRARNAGTPRSAFAVWRVAIAVGRLRSVSEHSPRFPESPGRSSGLRNFLLPNDGWVFPAKFGARPKILEYSVTLAALQCGVSEMGGPS
jgi:hypothetical protein